MNGVELDRTKNLYEYHNVFASALAAYMTAKAALDSETSPQAQDAKYREARSILRSNIIYAIAVKHDEPENSDIPHDPVGLVQWLDEWEKSLKLHDMPKNENLDALFALMVRKQEIAGIVPNPEKNLTSRLNFILAEVERQKKWEARE